MKSTHCNPIKSSSGNTLVAPNDGAYILGPAGPHQLTMFQMLRNRIELDPADQTFQSGRSPRVTCDLTLPPESNVDCTNDGLALEKALGPDHTWTDGEDRGKKASKRKRYGYSLPRDLALLAMVFLLGVSFGVFTIKVACPGWCSW